MSVDERLRIGMSRNALSLTPDIDSLLEEALALQRRSRRLRWAAASSLVAAACAAAVVVLPGGWGRDRGVPAVPAPSTTSSVVVQGRYTGEVAALPTAPSLAGSWVLEFKDAGVLAVGAPPAYPGVVSGVLYAVEGDELRTDLFSQDLCSGQSLGRYGVSRSASGLAFVAVDDPCDARVSVLGGTTWTEMP